MTITAYSPVKPNSKDILEIIRYLQSALIYQSASYSLFRKLLSTS